MKLQQFVGWGRNESSNLVTPQRTTGSWLTSKGTVKPLGSSPSPHRKGLRAAVITSPWASHISRLAVLQKHKCSLIQRNGEGVLDARSAGGDGIRLPFLCARKGTLSEEKLYLSNKVSFPHSAVFLCLTLHFLS